MGSDADFFHLNLNGICNNNCYDKKTDNKS